MVPIAASVNTNTRSDPILTPQLGQHRNDADPHHRYGHSSDKASSREAFRTWSAKLVSAAREAFARMFHGGLTDSAFWSANSENPDAQLTKAVQSLAIVLNGLRVNRD
ncbi:hypothetical protein [Paenibacillus agilis]|uniref:hypothetical protein n=1 Tax=Paenibacillus agilis TaxID=3020863 RepID=UPI003AB7A3D9